MKTVSVPFVAACAVLALLLELAIAPALILAEDAPPVVGDWQGTLNPGAQPLKPIVVHISAAQDGSLTGTIDYPEQDTTDIKMTAITYRKSILHFECTPSLTVYDGTMDQDHTAISGTMKQAGASLDLTLHRTP
jgi:hypothetical protein